jgi:hypothetical protein
MRKLLAIVVVGALGLTAGCAGADLAQQPTAADFQNPDTTYHPEAIYFANAVMENAIAGCRIRRINGELSGFVESANCSNAKIILAYGWINYPHMDLVRMVTAHRLAASERVDSGEWSEDQAQIHLTELGTAINAEVLRRQSLDVDTRPQFDSASRGDMNVFNPSSE